MAVRDPMRRLILMRHAKSCWADPEQRDRDRPLNARGRRSAPLLGAWLAKNAYAPDHALVSNARRARETWSGVTASVEPAPAEFLADLYAAAPETLMDRLRMAPDAERLLMLGHMPGIGAFARALLTDAPQDAQFDRYPTGATAVIDLPVDNWRDAGWGAGRLVDFVVPRSLD